MELRYLCGDDGQAYYAKGHVSFEEFMQAVALEAGEDSHLLKEKPCHTWLRVCRDFQEETLIVAEAKPESRGAFKATWIQD